MQDAVAQLLLVEVTHAENGMEFLLLTDRSLSSSVQAGVERLRDVPPRLHVVVLGDRDAADDSERWQARARTRAPAGARRERSLGLVVEPGSASFLARQAPDRRGHA